jgi:hypothetical protein
MKKCTPNPGSEASGWLRHFENSHPTADRLVTPPLPVLLELGHRLEVGETREPVPRGTTRRVVGRLLPVPEVVQAPFEGQEALHFGGHQPLAERVDAGVFEGLAVLAQTAGVPFQGQLFDAVLDDQGLEGRPVDCVFGHQFADGLLQVLVLESEALDPLDHDGAQSEEVDRPVLVEGREVEEVDALGLPPEVLQGNEQHARHEERHRHHVHVRRDFVEVGVLEVTHVHDLFEEVVEQRGEEEGHPVDEEGLQDFAVEEQVAVAW